MRQAGLITRWAMGKVIRQNVIKRTLTVLCRGGKRIEDEIKHPGSASPYRARRPRPPPRGPRGGREAPRLDPPHRLTGAHPPIFRRHRQARTRRHRERPEGFYFTTPIYYVNAAPHLGPRLHDHRGRRPGPLLPPAGVRRLLPHRHRRARRQDRQAAARKPAMTPQAYADRISGRLRNLWPELDVSQRPFIRTTEPTTQDRPGRPAARSMTRATSTSASTAASTASGCERFYHGAGAGRRQVPRPPDRARRSSRRATTSSA